MAPPRRGDLSAEEKDLLGVIAAGEPGPRPSSAVGGPGPGAFTFLSRAGEAPGGASVGSGCAAPCARLPCPGAAVGPGL